jgi:hypothetical protein
VAEYRGLLTETETSHPTMQLDVLVVDIVMGNTYRPFTCGLGQMGAALSSCVTALQ